MRKLTGAAALLLAGGLSPTPALAQGAIMASLPDVLGQVVAQGAAQSAYAACMSGTPVSAKEIAEARDPAPRVMQAYFSAAQGRGLKSAAFKLNKRTKWTAGKTVALASTLDAQADPLAAAGNTLEAAPLRFYRAGDLRTALGQWEVRDTSGGVAGVYTALFEREKGAWKLRELTVSQADDVVAPAAQYCDTPGDVTENGVKSSALQVEWATTQLAKRQASLAKAQDKARAAAEKAAGAPRGSPQAMTAAALQADADAQAKRVADAQEALAKAHEAQDKAAADAAQIESLTGPARDAEKLRLGDEAPPAA
jgi:hypothetical protein